MVRGSARFELAKVLVIESQLYFPTNPIGFFVHAHKPFSFRIYFHLSLSFTFIFTFLLISSFVAHSIVFLFHGIVAG